VKASVQNARLNTENVRLQESQAKQQLLSDILRALTDAQAARRNLDAANKNYDALNGAYNDTQKRFEIGAANTFELVSAKNNLDNAHRNTIIRKYDYIFKMKVLDYYAGRQIILE
ncbi:MAG TPA: TolC family protein, partial [Saprospiraceae bacterium]|nr:TolC family protein [Saprospiraceae bacterium]